MRPRDSEWFICEPLIPRRMTRDTSAMARGEPGLPDSFVWRGREYVVAEVLKAWKETGPETPGSSSTYLKRHWYRVRMETGELMTLYYDRRPGRGNGGKRRWWVYTVCGKSRSADQGLAGPANPDGL